MKLNRRILSMLLAICLVAVLIPAVASAEVSLPSDVLDDETVSFAGHDWIVIDNNADYMTLLLKTAEASIAYNTSGLSNSWDSSDAKTWCETFKAKNNIPFDVFFLSHDEVVTYFANNAAEILRATDSNESPIGWWLRYTDNVDVGGDLFGLAISDAGFMGTPHVATNYGARPAIKIPAEKIAAVDGTLKIVEADSFKDFNASVTIAEDKSSATITYSGAKAGSVTYMLIDRAGTKKMAGSETVADGASGTIEIGLTVTVGEYTLRVFNESNNTTSAIIEAPVDLNDNESFDIVGAQATIAGEVAVNFDVKLHDDIKGSENAYITVSTGSGEKTIPVSKLQEPSQNGEAHGATGLLSVSMKAPQMNDKITVRVHDDEGTAVAEHSYTVREYAESIVNGNYDDAAKDLAKHMLNYGAMAQIYFDYNAKDLANKNIDLSKLKMKAVPYDESLKAQKGNDYDAVTGIQFYGVSLVMNAQTTLRFYFKLTGSETIDKYEFAIDEFKVNVSKRVVNGDELYFVDLNNLAPHELNTKYTVHINDREYVSYNPMAYIQRQYKTNTNVNFKNMLHALYNYYDAAVNYQPNAVN